MEKIHHLASIIGPILHPVLVKSHQWALQAGVTVYEAAANGVLQHHFKIGISVLALAFVAREGWHIHLRLKKERDEALVGAKLAGKPCWAKTWFVYGHLTGFGFICHHVIEIAKHLRS